MTLATKKGLSQLACSSIVHYCIYCGRSGKNYKTLQFVSKVRSNLPYFLYVAYEKDVDSGTRKLNFTLNFGISHKKGLSQLACSNTLLYCIYSGRSGENCKPLQFVSKVRSNVPYFLYVAYEKDVDSGTRKLNFTLNFGISHKKGLSQLACSNTLLYCIYSGRSGENCKPLQFVSKVRSNLHYFLYVAYGKDVDSGT